MINIAEQYLIDNPTLKLSVKSIAKRTGLSVGKVTYICHHSKVLRKVNPLEVGSLKTNMNTFTSI
jgi:hypothetical protein